MLCRISATSYNHSNAAVCGTLHTIRYVTVWHKATSAKLHAELCLLSFDHRCAVHVIQNLLRKPSQRELHHRSVHNGGRSISLQNIVCMSSKCCAILLAVCLYRIVPQALHFCSTSPGGGLRMHDLPALLGRCFLQLLVSQAATASLDGPDALAHLITAALQHRKAPNPCSGVLPEPHAQNEFSRMKASRGFWECV